MKGILFKPDMVKAIAEGRKTVTRRVIKPFAHGESWLRMRDGITFKMPEHADALVRLHAHCRAGDTVYVKEAWWDRQDRVPQSHDRNAIHYGEWSPPDDMAYMHRKKSPLFMPEWAARYFITITGVRAERLQEITEEGIRKEGFDSNYTNIGYYYVFGQAWNHINPKYPWHSNPWVWTITFRLKEGNDANT